MKSREIVLRYVKDAFDAISDTYDHARGRIWFELVEDVASNCGFNSLVLDAGCGTGRYSLHLAARGCRVIMMDLSRKMVEKCSEKSRRRGLELTFPLVGDARYPPLRDRSLTYVVSIAAIHHIPERVERVLALRRLGSLLKEKGLLIVSTWSLLQPRLFYLAFKTWLKGEAIEFGDAFVPWTHRGRKVSRFYHLFRRGELRRLALEAELDVDKAYAWNATPSLFPQNFVCKATRRKG